MLLCQDRLTQEGETNPIQTREQAFQPVNSCGDGHCTNPAYTWSNCVRHGSWQASPITSIVKRKVVMADNDEDDDTNDEEASGTKDPEEEAIEKVPEGTPPYV